MTPDPTSWGSRGRRFKSGRPDQRCRSEAISPLGEMASRSFGRSIGVTRERLVPAARPADVLALVGCDGP
jgi:hypothetical protein